jgi:protein kinase A
MERAHSSNREMQIVQHQKAKARHHTIYAIPIDLDEHFEAPVFPKSDAEKRFIAQALHENFIFSHMNADEKECLIGAMEKDVQVKGIDVIKQGEMGDYFYILRDGEIDFFADGEMVGSCTPGGSFGELALLYDWPRAATCRTNTDCVLWKVGQNTFRHMLARSAQTAQKGIFETVRSIPLFENMSSSELTKFASALTPLQFEEGERIIIKGEVGEVFYIIQDGTVRCHDIGHADSQYTDQLLLSKGDWFGEFALLTGERRAANVTAVTKVECLTLDRATFETCFGSLQLQLERGMKKKFIETLPIFANSNFNEHEISELAGMITEQCIRKGYALSEAGKPYEQNLWIIEKGRVVVTNTNGDLFTLEPDDYFGDKSIKGEPGQISSHTAIAEEDCTCFVLTRPDIEKVIGDINRLGEPLPFTPSKVNKTLQLKDMKLHHILGMGAFGKVWLASTTTDDTPYALKQLDKRQLIKSNQVRAIFREKSILYSIEHPFLLSLVASFQDEDHVYLVLHLLQGGELFSVIQRGGPGGVPNSHAVFYGGCIIAALDHLHLRSICYRDLKPENAMVNADGYCILIDMGFSKVVMEKTFTLCGTPEYLAPEIILSQGHNKGVDNWAFGVLVFELLVGRSPFYLPGSDQLSLFKRIVHEKYQIPSNISDEARDLITKLLVRRPFARLGSLARGNRDIQDHPWFKEIAWKDLLQKKIAVPWVPEIKNPFDASHFDDYSAAKQKPSFTEKLDKQQQLLFKDF